MFGMLDEMDDCDEAIRNVTVRELGDCVIVTDDDDDDDDNDAARSNSIIPGSSLLFDDDGCMFEG
jgi:hypothetical protein